MLTVNPIKISVVIPTYNRCEVLQECLGALARQSLASARFEVILIDDGSTDSTAKVAKEKWPYRMSFLRQRHFGPGKARNLGIAEASGDIVLMIGDDIIPSEFFLEKHLKSHRKDSYDKVAVLGLIEWHPQVKITPFLHFITDVAGYQFGFKNIENPRDAGFGYFYSSNISLKRTFLSSQRELFDTEFKYAAFEDIELGYRLEKQGMKIKFDKEALAHHLHEVDLGSYIERQKKVGQMAILFAGKHPELDDVLLSTEKIKAQAKPMRKKDLKNLIKGSAELERLDFSKFESIGQGDGRLDRQLLNVLYSLYETILLDAYVQGVLSVR